MARWEPDARGRLVLAALDLYAERGFDAATAADVAERAGVTERTFFRYFPDKREVLFDASGSLDAAVVGAVPGTVDAASALRTVRTALLAGAALLDERREFAARRAAVIAAHPALQERELLKMSRLGAELTAVLSERGVADAALVVETGVAVFRVAFDEWVAGTAGGVPGDDRLVTRLDAAFDRFEALVVPRP
ncbi:TetR family transcriptional regulator [Isoptericola aurantiacus]|uniref:TetR family transcriptional regulator n=1 Tax=Isoptericola aurantiacus TaxID=3377839 RepID=UPI00383B024A